MITTSSEHTVDWRMMFAKYMDVVGSNEGVHFLYVKEWDRAEWDAIVALYNEIQIPKGWRPFTHWDLEQ